jgi:hypothetical protein
MKVPALALLLVSVSAFASDVPSDLRLYNGNVSAVRVAVSCGDGVIHNLKIEPRATVDVAAEDLTCGAANAKVEAERPVVVIRMPRTDGEQQIVRANASCDEVALQLPSNGCRFGVASAAIAPIAGASYSWAIEGGSFLSGAGSERVLISLGSGATTKVTVIITTPSCTSTATGVINLHDAATIATLTSTGGNAGSPVTISWSYPGATPATQAISGTDFPTPVVIPAADHSYTYTPSEAGDKEVTLSASFAQAAIRTRPSARAIVSSSGCAAARLSANYHVNACVVPSASIAAPTSVQAGATFAANAGVHEGATITWTVKNGTPSSTTGERITVKAGNEGVVALDVRIVTGPACVAMASRNVTISPNLVCDDPAAYVTAGDYSCEGGTINVSFLGTPPFNVTWNDGLAMTSQAATMTRFVTHPGNYSTTKFSDAACAGTPNGNANFTTFVPTWSLTTADGACDTSTLIARFTGKPPFTGVWSDGQTFTTSQTTLERKPSGAGRYSLTSFRDANCAGVPQSAQSYVDVKPAPQAQLTLNPNSSSCFSPPAAASVLQVAINGNGPHLILWSDGFLQTAPGTPANRFVSPSVDTTYSVVSVKTADCPAKVIPASITVHPLYLPNFSFGPGIGCPGKPLTATLDNPLRPDATVTWTAQNGTIAGGQGTPTVSFSPTAAGSTRLTATVALGSCSMTLSQDVKVYGSPAAPKLTIEPGTIPVGGSAVLTVTFDENVASVGYDNSRHDRMEPLGQCVGRTCQSTYTNTTGAGPSTIIITYTGQCYDGLHQTTIPLTITP